MKSLMFGLTMSLGVLASGVSAEEMVTVDGVDYPLSVLTKNCQSMSDKPQAMIACFNVLSEFLDKQSSEEQKSVPVPQALEELQAVAEYKGEDSGLSIAGTGCSIQITYFDNYFHISRRNVSTIDLFSAKLDASKLQYDQITEVRGAQAPLSRGLMDVGATAVVRGGVALDSNANNFTSKSARSTLEDYANEVVGQLPTSENQAFEFVLIHPERSQDSANIWSAFETLVKACKA